MASDVEICNLALSHIGSSSIQSLDDASKQGRQCKILYAHCRDAVLRDFDWGFARKRLIMGLLSETYPGWTYAYQYPTDCLVARKIYNAAEAHANDKINFEIGISDDLSRSTILTDQNKATLIYTAAVTNAVLFDSTFSDALSWRLAADLAVPVKGDSVLQKRNMDQYLHFIGKAESSNANEGQQKPDNSSSFVRAR